jgi:endogenous inhibitor of DNA gyrase (YacG/DUF329 family)
MAIALEYLRSHTCCACGGAIERDERFDHRRVCDCRVTHRQKWAVGSGSIPTDRHEHNYARTKEDHLDT